MASIGRALEEWFGQAIPAADSLAARKAPLRQALDRASDRRRAKRFSLHKGLVDEREVARLRQAGEYLLAFGGTLRPGQERFRLDDFGGAGAGPGDGTAAGEHVGAGAGEELALDPTLSAGGERPALLRPLRQGQGRRRRGAAAAGQHGARAELPGGGPDPPRPRRDAGRAERPARRVVGRGLPGHRGRGCAAEGSGPGRKAGPQGAGAGGRGSGPGSGSGPGPGSGEGDGEGAPRRALPPAPDRGFRGPGGAQREGQRRPHLARGAPAGPVAARPGRARGARPAAQRRAPGAGRGAAPRRGPAAGQSQARSAPSVAVDYTQRRNVARIKGAPPGLVTYRGERTLHVPPTALG